jgi:electron transfer flavoprotein alpha subunit
MKKVGILIETENGQIKETNYGVISLACQGDVERVAVLLEKLNDRGQETLAAHGVHKIVEMVFPADVLENPAVLARNVVSVVKELEIHTILGLSSAWGRDLIPRIAASLDAPLVMDCMDVDLEENIAKTSQYSGKTIANIKLTGPFVLFGIRPNAIPFKGIPKGSAADIPEYLQFKIDPAVPDNFKMRVLDDAGAQNMSLPEAEIIIAGGRGMKNKENFSLLFDCARKLKGVVGASRVAVDNGWIPYAHQVGQTGEKVSPLVYIACGISGSIQHFAGMKTARLIIAVNSDENTAIFANCDYYVKGDVLEIIPELTRQL